MTFGEWIIPATIVVIGVAFLEGYDTRLAYGLAIIILLALMFRYPLFLQELMKALGYKSQLPPNERT